MKKILIYNGQLFMGGIERVLITYLKALVQEKDLEITLLIKENNPDRNVFVRDIPENIRVEYIKTPEEIEKREKISAKKNSVCYRIYYQINLVLERLRMRKFLKEFFQKNTFHAVIDFDMGLGKYISVVPGKKIGWNHYSLAAKKGKKRERFRKRLASYDKLVVICDEMKKEMEEIYPEFASKTVRLYNPMDVEGIREMGSEEVISSSPYMVAVSRLVKGKGREDLIEIYSQLKKRGIKEKLYILGDGAQYENLKNLIAHYNLEEDVFLMGQKSNPYTWMKGAKLFLHTSYGEGLPTVMIESMINNCTVVAYDCPTGPREILGDGRYGVLIEMGNKKSFEEAVYLLLRDEKKIESYREKFHEQIEKFSRKVIIDSLKEVLEDVS